MSGRWSGNAPGAVDRTMSLPASPSSSNSPCSIGTGLRRTVWLPLTLRVPVPTSLALPAPTSLRL
jgi:hypothetical protein